MNKSFRDLLVSEDDEFGETLVIIDGEEGVPGDERFENVVGKINAVFNARVEEEVRKAVEDNEGFKAKLIESMNCPEDADPVWAHGFKVAQVAIAKIVRAKNLPREFPGAGEIK